MHLTTMNYTVKSRIWIESDEGVCLGNGRVRLLKAIEATGSLSKAAKSINMSYKKAWNLIDAVNNNAEEPVVITATGGKDGGGARVTAYGKTLIQQFDKLNHETIDFVNRQKPFA
jgi:molybdate transport system regulatory protein